MTSRRLFLIVSFLPVYFSGSVSGVPPHRALMFAAWKVLAARNVKSTGKFSFIGINVTTTGAVVPGVKAGIITTALIGVPITVSDCKPVPALT